MRICIFAKAMRLHRPGYLWPFELLSRTFTGLGHDVTVLTTALEGGSAEHLRDGALEVVHLAGTTPEKIDAAYWQASADAFARVDGAAPFDLVLGRSASSWGYLSRPDLRRVPLISHEGTYPGWMHRIDIGGTALERAAVPLAALRRAARNRPMRLALQRSARVACLSPALASALRRAQWWQPPRVVVLPYGFDIDGFAGQARGTAAEGPPRLVSVGRLTRGKGAEDLIEVLARLRRRDVLLDAVGPVDPGYRAELERMAEARGLGQRFRMVGAVPHEALPGRLAGAAAFLFPSTHAEGLSKVVQEAMAMALPVVAYALPTLPALIEQGRSGIMVPAGRTAAMAAGVDRLLADPGAAAQMGAAGRGKLEREFAPQRIAGAWQALFDEVLAEAGRAGR